MKKDTVIFDLDGTLLDTLDDLADSVDSVMKAFGWPSHTREEIRGYVGNGVRKLVERSVPDGEENPRFEEAFAFFKSTYAQNCNVKTHLYDGVEETVNALVSKGYKLAVVSNKNDENVKTLCAHYFGESIPFAFGQNDYMRKKPAPDLTEHAINVLKSEKGRVVYVGDSQIDAETALNTGIDCVLVSWGFRDRDVLEPLRSIAVIDAPCELLRVLGET